MLSDVQVHVRFRLSALWAAVMLCYVYGDTFGFFRRDTLGAIVAGVIEAILTVTIVWQAWRRAGLAAAARRQVFHPGPSVRDPNLGF